MKVDGDNVLVIWEEDGDVFSAHSNNVGASFGSPINLSNSGTAFFATLATGGGAALVAWMDDFGSGVDDIFATYSTEGGAGFTLPITVSNSVGESSFPHTALSGDTLLVTWGDDTAGGNDIYVSRSTDGGTAFGNAVNVSNGSGLAGNPRIGFIP
jgi:hypothetical protein